MQRADTRIIQVFIIMVRRVVMRTSQILMMMQLLIHCAIMVPVITAIQTALVKYMHQVLVRQVNIILLLQQANGAVAVIMPVVRVLTV